MPEPSPGWFVDGALLALGIGVVVTVVTCLWRARRAGWARTGLAVAVALVGAGIATSIWVTSAEASPGSTDGRAVLCQYDSLSMAASSGPMTAADRACRSDSIVRVGLGAAVALGSCGLAVAFSHRWRVVF